MPQVTIRRPLGELDLRNQLGFEPQAAFHLFLSQGPLRPLLLQQIGKREASCGLRALQQLFLVYLSQQPGETISAESLVSSTQFFPMRDKTIEATLSSPNAANAFATATTPDRLCLFSAATIARRRSAFVEE